MLVSPACAGNVDSAGRWSMRDEDKLVAVCETTSLYTCTFRWDIRCSA